MRREYAHWRRWQRIMRLVPQRHWEQWYWHVPSQAWQLTVRRVR